MKKFFAPLWGIVIIASLLYGCGKETVVDGPDQIIVDPTEKGDSVLLHASFNEAIPQNWLNIDQDGDGNRWCLYSDIFGYAGRGYENSNCVASSSEYNITPDNYLVSPEIHIPGSGGYTLSFWVSALDANKYRESYTVYVGKIKDGAFVPTGTLLSTTTDDCLLHYQKINLDNYKGHNLRIAFRHHNTSQMAHLLIDEVNVTL